MHKPKYPVISRTTGLPIDAKRSRAAKKAAQTRKANAAAQAENMRSLRLHHKVIVAGAVIGVLVFAFLGIRSELQTYAASTATGTFVGLGGKCLDNSGARLQQDNRVQLYKCNGTIAQKWSVTASGSLKANAGSDFCLDIPNNSKAEYAYLRLWKCNDTAAQHFTAKNGLLRGNITGFCATVRYAETANGTRVWMKTCHGSAAQKWGYSQSVGSPSGPIVAQPTNGGGAGSVTGDKWGTDWKLGQTKPSSASTGTGIIRPKPTIVVSSADGTIKNGVITITKSLKDRIVPYVIKVGADNLTIENNDIKGSAAYPDASYTFINTNGRKGTLARFNEIHSSFVNEALNGIQAPNITARYNNIHHVVDGIKPTIHGNNNFVAEGNYVHDFMFFAPSKGHANTPVSKEVAGQWGETPWDHADGAQIEYDDTTGVRWYGNTIIALWAQDGLTTMPLPKVVKELSCFMLNGGRNIDIGYNWLDGGEECINNADANVTGKIYNNRFGRQTVHGASGSDSSYLSLYIAAPGLITTGNVWEDTGNAVPRHKN